MKQFTDLVISFGRAVVAVFDAWVAIWYPPRVLAPFIGKAGCAETIGYTYLCRLADVSWPPAWGPREMDFDVLHTDLGNGGPMYLRGVADDGCQVYGQQNSVVIVVVLPPGLVIPDLYRSRVELAKAAAGRLAFHVE